LKKIIEKIKKSWLIKRTSTIIFMLILVAVFIALTLFVNNLDLDPIDFTSEQLYTLTATSKEQVKTVEQDVNIYFVGYSETDSIVDLAKQYHNANEKINVEVVDATSRPDLANEYGIESGSTGVIVESGDKSKILSSYDFYTYDLTTYEEIDITEEKLTNSILYVVADEIPTVYFLEGYSEFSISENLYYLATYLANEVTEYDTLNLLTAGSVPEDCDTLIIQSPEKDFDDVATEAIIQYINNGGNILWFNLVVTEEQDFPNVNKVLALYGIDPFEVGVINETDSSKMMSGAASIIVPDVSYSDITKNIPAVLFVNATKINFVSDEELENLNVTTNTLLEASEGSYFRTDFTISSTSRQSSEEEGPFVVGAEVEKVVSEANEETGESEKVSKLVIYGENLFISDYTLSSSSSYPIISYSYNKDLAMDSIAYLVDRQVDIVIRKDTSTVNYTATVEQDNIIQGVIFGVPVFIIFVGILVWQHRRRKK
jgi:ABC-2 type transport system permease protein